MDSNSSLRRTLVAILVALVYGLLGRMAFSKEGFTGPFEIVSWSFIIGMPFAIGATTTYVGFRLGGKRKFWSFGAPCLTVCLALAASVAFRLEASICALMASPIFILGAIFGGGLMGASLRTRYGDWAITIFLLLPYLAAPFETFWKQPAELVAIEDSVFIAASPETIWREIVSVRTIEPAELPSQFIYRLDFPKPISAVIDREGVGARRLARFDRGVSFFETVTVWEPYRALAFIIKADPAFIPHTAFDQHIIVGGRFYSVLDGRYDIRPDIGGCRLVLTSTHRLSSPFNRYASWWSHWIMRQIQGSILTVIQHRAESATRAAG